MFYRNLFLIYILLFIKICIIFSKNTEHIDLVFLLNPIADHENAYHRKMINEFNNVYSIENNLNITVVPKLIPLENNGDTFKNYGFTFLSGLNRKKTTFDIIQNYSVYSKIYGDYFEELDKYFNEEDLKIFNPEILDGLCRNYNKKLIGLPFSLNVNALYSNEALLKKYDREIPKTWNQLIETCKIVYEGEAKNNTKIIPYKSTIEDQLSGTLMLAEFVNSFRDDQKDKTPKITSEETKEALHTLKDMINEFGIDNFKLDFSMYNPNGIFKDEILFLVYSMAPYDPRFLSSALPGKKEGVSGTYLGSNNFSINKFIDKRRKEAAITFLKFFILKDVQFEYIIKDQFLGGNMDLYKKGEISCDYVNCEVIDNIQPFSFLDNDKKFFGNDEYFRYYQKYMLDYLFYDQDLDYILKRLDDITKIYTFSLNTEDSIVGLIIYIIFITFFAVIALSIVFVFVKKLEYRFKFLSKNLWILTTLGSLILLSSIITLYGEVSNAKCHLRTTLINVGFILSICPSLHKLISNFPERNEISLIFRINKYFTIVIIMLITVALNETYAMSSFTIYEVNGDGNPNLDLNSEPRKHFNKCVMNSTIGNIIYYIIQSLNFIVILTLLALIFIEWNLKETALDVKYLATALFMDTLSLITLMIFNKITIENYILSNLVLAINILVFAVSNHLFIYLVRILPVFRPDTKFEDSRKILGKISSSGHNGSNKRAFANSSYNKPTLSSTSSFNKNSMAFYSNLANSPYSNRGTSFYNNDPTSSNNSIGTTSHSSNVGISSYNNNIGTSSYNNNIGTSSYNNNIGTSSYNNNIGTSSYNKRSNSSNTKYSMPSNYSSKNNDFRKSTTSSGSGGTRRGGFTKRIMDYHNQTDLYS